MVKDNKIASLFHAKCYGEILVKWLLFLKLQKVKDKTIPYYKDYKLTVNNEHETKLFPQVKKKDFKR